MFSGCSGIESIAPDAFTGLNGTSLNFQKAFLNCTSLREIPDGAAENHADLNLHQSVRRLHGTGPRRVGGVQLRFGHHVQFGLRRLYVARRGRQEHAGQPRQTDQRRESLPRLRDAQERSVSLVRRSREAQDADFDLPGLRVARRRIALHGRRRREIPPVRPHGGECRRLGTHRDHRRQEQFRGMYELSDYDKIPTTWKE